MDCANNQCLDSDVSEASTEPDSQESLIIIPDTEDSRNSFYSNAAYDDSNFIDRADHCKILPKGVSCKSTETSFLDYDLNDGSSPYPSPLSKSLSETLYFCKKIIDPFQKQFTVHAADNLDGQSLEDHVTVSENHSNFSFPNKEIVKNPKSLALRLCSNSIRNVKASSSAEDYHSTCNPKQNQSTADSACLDKTQTEVCEGKSKAYHAKPCLIKDNSATNTKAKRSSTNIPRIQSKISIESTHEQEAKKVDERKFSCLPASAHKCCSGRLRMPPCTFGDADEVKKPKKEEKSCCSVLENFKSSYTNLHICSPHFKMQPQSSNSSDNETTPPSISKKEVTSSEPLVSCISTTQQGGKKCKNKPSCCANTFFIKSSETLIDDHKSFMRLNKCPSIIKIQDIEYKQALDQDQTLDDEDHLSNANLFTESQRNFNTYYEFSKSAKSKKVSNCMKVKVIPSTTDLTQSEMSVTVMKVDLNEAIPTCKITSEDLTTLAKDFFGNIYTKTKDAMTTIRRESERHLEAVLRKTQSSNTDEVLPPPKVLKNKSIETPSTYLLDMKYRMKMVDESTSKTGKRRRGKKVAMQSSHSAVNFCTCSKRYREPGYASVAIQEPPQPPNSVFTAIKSKIFSIFREDENVVSAYKATDSESTDSMSDAYEDSERSLRTLQKPN